MGENAPDTSYELDEQLNAEIIALAQRRNEPPQQLVREAVAKYLLDAEYEIRRSAALAALTHPHRDNSMFGAWRGTDIDGVEYQSDLRSQ
jgi:predicted transcriptional regulator